MQYEITKAIPLLKEDGDLTQPGFARKLLPVYDRSKVKGGIMRLKEWDYYYVGNDRFGIALTIADNSYMGFDAISFMNFEGKTWQINQSSMSLFPMGKRNLPPSSTSGISASAGKGYTMRFVVEEGKRTLTAHMDNFREKEAIDVEITLTQEPEESMVICTPFEKKAHFYYNQKINCMRAKGTVKIGEECFTFEPDTAFGLLDWGRGVWTYENTWYWGSASGIVDGADFGFNIGYGFGDTTAATENMLFYNGKSHKLSQVTFHIPMKNGAEDYMSPWKFSSDDGRFEMDFVPVLDRHTCADVKVIISDQHQVFGRFTGTAVLDDGTKVEIRDLMGFAEKVRNKW